MLKKFTKEEIIALFPLKAQISEETLEQANRYDVLDCVGYRTLKSALPEMSNDIAWGTVKGSLYITSKDEFRKEQIRDTEDGVYSKHVVYIGTIEGINMIDVRKPMEVTFIVVSKINEL